VRAAVGVQRLSVEAKASNKLETGLPFDVLVVPLEQELDRDGDAAGSVGQGLVAVIHSIACTWWHESHRHPHRHRRLWLCSWPDQERVFQ
jgi:hypothetical protein